MKFVPFDQDQFPTMCCALQQSTGHARALKALGARSEMFIATEDTRPVAKVHLVSRRLGPLKLVWLPRGPVWHTDICPELRARAMWLLSGMLKPRATWIITPDTPEETRYFRHTTLISPQHVAEIDLTASPETLLAALHGKWRNRLRHALRSDLRVKNQPFKPDRDKDLLRLEAKQRQERRYKALPPAFMHAWAEANPTSSRLFTVTRRGAALAYLLVLLHRPAATYHIGWSGPEGRRCSAHNLALWEAMAWLVDEGYQRFDLGSVDTENAPGLARFKIGSGAHIRSLGPTCLHLPRLRLKRAARRTAA